MTERVSIVGLGQMGLPIASRLASAFEVTAFDISAERRALADRNDRIQVTQDLAFVAKSDIIVISLPAPRVSRQVISELAGLIVPGTTIIETSTVLPGDVREWQRLVEPSGARVVDAAVLSGVAQMEQGQATLLVGGEDRDVRRVQDVLDSFGGGGVRRFGTVGSGMAAKVVNNGVAHAVMVVLVEAFAMAAAEGLELPDIAQMLGREDGGLQRPLNHRIMHRMARGEFEGGMPLEAARKDSVLALAMAQSSGTPLFSMQAAQSVYDIASGMEMGRKDYSAISLMWEEWTGRSLSYQVDEPKDGTVTVKMVSSGQTSARPGLAADAAVDAEALPASAPR